MKIENLTSTGTDKKQWINPDLVLIDKDYIQGGVNINELESTNNGLLSS